MVPLLALGKGVEGGLGEHVFEVVKVVRYSISEGFWLYIPGEGLCQMLQCGLTSMDLHNVQ